MAEVSITTTADPSSSCPSKKQPSRWKKTFMIAKTMSTMDVLRIAKGGRNESSKTSQSTSSTVQPPTTTISTEKRGSAGSTSSSTSKMLPPSPKQDHSFNASCTINIPIVTTSQVDGCTTETASFSTPIRHSSSIGNVTPVIHNRVSARNSDTILGIHSPPDKSPPAQSAPIIHLDSHSDSHLNHSNHASSPHSIKPGRRSLDSEVTNSTPTSNSASGSFSRAIGSPNRSGGGGASPQASHCSSLAEVLASRPSIERTLLAASAGTHHIPDNYNTTLINQLNKNYLKSICRQNKARNDWKSLKAKLSALRRKDSGEKGTENVGTLQLPATSTGSKRGSLETAINTDAITSVRKTSNQDEGIICRKEDLLRLLQNTTSSKQHTRKPLKSISDVVLQLRNDGRFSNSAGKKSKPADTTVKAPGQGTLDTVTGKMEDKSKQERDTSTVVISLETSKKSADQSPPNSIGSNGSRRHSNEKETTESNMGNKESPPTDSAKESQIRSMLKGGNGSNKTAKAVVVLGQPSQSSIVSKKKVKIVDAEAGRNRSVRNKSTIVGDNVIETRVKEGKTNQNSIRKIAECVDTLVAEEKKKLMVGEEVDQTTNQLEERLRRECLDDDDDDDDDKHDKHDNRVKWDESNLVDAAALGDAIQAFLRGISSSSNDKKVSFKKV